MKQAKGFTIVEVVVAIVLLALVGGGVYAWQQGQAKDNPKTATTPTPTQSPTTNPTTNSETKLYSSECGYSFEYPSSAEIEQKDQDKGCMQEQVRLKFKVSAPLPPGYFPQIAPDGFYLLFGVEEKEDSLSLHDFLVKYHNEYPEDEMGYWDIKTLKEFNFANVTGYTFKDGACSDGCSYQKYIADLKRGNARLWITDIYSPNQVEVLKIIHSVKEID